MNEMRLQGTEHDQKCLVSFSHIYLTTVGLFLRVSRDLLGATLIANGTNYTTSTLIHAAELRNLNTGAAFYFARHDASTYDTGLCPHSSQI